MYTYTIDVERASLVGIRFGAASTEADFQATFDSMGRILWQESDEVGRIILVIGSGQHAPSPTWRQKYAQHPGKRPYRLAVVSESATTQRVMTAIDWVRTPRRGQVSTQFATLAEAIADHERDAGHPLPHLDALYRKARRAADAAAPPRQGTG